jgi:hypothetical protein
MIEMMMPQGISAERSEWGRPDPSTAFGVVKQNCNKVHQ